MSEAFPVKKIRKLWTEVSSFMNENPDATVTYTQRLSYGVDKKGGFGVRVEASSPVALAGAIDATGTTGLQHHWEKIGEGQGVFRVHRIGKAEVEFAKAIAAAAAAGVDAAKALPGREYDPRVQLAELPNEREDS